MKIISRKDAKKDGLKRYFTGMLCVKGHLSEKFVSNFECCSCADERRFRELKTKVRKVRIKKSKEELERVRKKCEREYILKNKDRKRIYDAEYRKLNLGRIKKRSAEYFKKNKEKISMYRKRRYKENPPDRISQRSACHKRRLRIRENGGQYTKLDIENIFKGQRGKCAYCRKILKKFHIDHIVPLSKNGSNWPRNIQLLCASCNLAKNSKMPEDFMRGQRFLL